MLDDAQTSFEGDELNIEQPKDSRTAADAASINGEVSPTAFERSARAEAARHDAPDSKLSDVSSLRVGDAGVARPTRCVLQRVVMPRIDDPLEVRPLYLDEPATPTGRSAEVESRRAVTVPAWTQLSFATYFNAFPASYWKRWTRVDEVALRLTVRGAGRVDLYRSRPSGDIVHLQGKQLDTGDDSLDVEFRVSLAPFEDGGWVWFDVTTRRAPLTVDDASWSVDAPLPDDKIAVAITTFNRPGDCVTALAALADDEAVLDRVANVFVVDQGTVKVRGHSEFVAASAKLGDRLTVIDQSNLGGSGGFTRGILEAIEHTDVEHVLLMDDDVRIEPDSVLRLAAFASAATSPVLVGAHMLNLQARGRLHRMGEIVDLKSVLWRPAPGAVVNHDFDTMSLRQQRLLHKRIDSNYTAWWMCLIPREVIANTGLPMPMFIKWDDVEYGLRAAERGYPTVTLPGAAIWHMPWSDKNDSTDWTAYFHHRNRLITAALHSPYDVRPSLVQDGMRRAFKHLMLMEYSTVALHIKAIEDFLAGPSRLFDSLRFGLTEVRDLRSGYDDARMQPSAQQFPAPSFDPSRVERLMQPPVNPIVIAAKAASTITHHLRAPRPDAMDRPQLNVPAQSALWFLLGSVDSATVSNADGSAVAFRRRSPREFRRLSARVVTAYGRLVAEWSDTSKAYRAALPELTSAESWRAVFAHDEAV